MESRRVYLEVRNKYIRKSGVLIQGLPSPDEKKSSFILFRVMFTFYNSRGAVLGGFLQMYFLCFYAQLLSNAWGTDTDADPVLGFSRK
jgi:hypothetical protein